MRTDFKFWLSAPQPKSVWFTTGVREPAYTTNPKRSKALAAEIRK
jgi:hypothetical protein